jgi:hypothetical protein
MNSIKVLRLNEWHPGADSIETTIERFVNRAHDKMGIPLGISYRAMRRILDLYLGNENNIQVEEGSVMHKALLNIENCINTLTDDGWPEEWIYKEIEKIIDVS